MAAAASSQRGGSRVGHPGRQLEWAHESYPQGAIFGGGVALLILRTIESLRPSHATVTHAIALTLFAALLMSGIGAAVAADEAPDAIMSGAPPAARALRLGPDPSPLPEASPFSLLPDEARRGVGPDQGWALLADDEKALSSRGIEEPKKAGPDWPGIGRDTAFFFGYQIVSVGILYVLPGDLNRWSNKDVSLHQWWDNVRNPVWDSDPWGTNYISHPYWGATYYIRARERGFGKLASFGYSAFLSTLYEFGAEAFFEPPSGQDLIVTPILGSLVGAFIFEPIRDWIKVKPQLKWYDHAILIATDPFGALNSVFEVMLGIKSEILFRPVPPTLGDHEPTAGFRGRRADGSRPNGASVSLRVVWE